MAKRKKRGGAFIVFEGIDGSGTTTQATATTQWLRDRGFLVHQTREPSGGPIGSLLRQVLRGRLVTRQLSRQAKPLDPATIALLFAADRLDHIENEIQPYLEEGHYVISDRYVLSSLAYQSIEVDLRFVRQVNEKAIAPDLTLFLDVSPEAAMQRVDDSRHARDAFESLAFQRKVGAAYTEILGTYRDGRVVTIDGEKSVSEVTRRIRTEIEALL